MAYDPLVMADLVGDALDLSDAEVTDLVQSVPFLNLLPMEESSNGETYKYVKETGAPVVGFRAPNVGRDMDSSVDTVVTVTLKILDYSYDMDKAVGDIWRKGKAAALLAREGLRSLRAALVAFEKQIIYGSTALGDSGGFTGMIQATSVDALADALTIDATGAAADTASSVWAVRVGPNDLTGIFNGDGPPMREGEPTVIQKLSSGTLAYPAYYVPACTWLAMQVGSIYSMGRIVDLTAESNKTLTDVLMANLLSEFPVGRTPTHWLMSRRSLAQLRALRTATNATGAPAPFPTEAHGIPIVVCESIVNTEAIVA